MSAFDSQGNSSSRFSSAHKALPSAVRDGHALPWSARRRAEDRHTPPGALPWRGGLALIAALGFAATLTLPAAPATLSIDAAHPGHPISPLLYGIFFEDINCSADGGLYAELVRNRNFEDSTQPDYWSAVGSDPAGVELTIDSSKPASPKNLHSLKVQISRKHPDRVGVANSGFWGMSLIKGEGYELSLLARGGDGFTGPLMASLESTAGVVYAQAKLPSLGPNWKHYELKLAAKGTDPKARLVLSTTGSGTFWVDMVSLFPKKTWKNRPNGLRPDLAEMLMGMRPGFVRFPGGCWVEGDTMALAYRWKQTVGDPSERRTQYNIWKYQATHGIGFHEYLQLCEDLGAEPLFVINCGMSHKETVPLDKMPEFVQDALDAIEYANGPMTSTWGALRAKNGHPAPFHLRYMEIGNENGGRAYYERYPLFYDAIKAKYPEMHLVADEWHGIPRNHPVELVDEHYYSSPEFFINNAGKYDTYDRAGHKVYVGEYAVTQGCGQGNLRAAIGEAAFMTGMERNSDVVQMASYAPLFANVNYKKWNPDLIDFDSSRVYGLPSYYVQKMFGENRGDVVLPVTIDAPEAAPAARAGAIGVGTWRTEAEFKDLKVTRGDETLLTCDFASGTNGWKFRGGGEWSVQEGALQQKSQAENIRAYAGNKNWKDYTYTLKARKLGGNEGFLIPVLVQDENAKTWWNLGGWGNTQHGLEVDGAIVTQVPGSIETGRWYDLRLEVKDTSIKCYLDGKLVHDVSYPKTKPLYAVASRAKGGREIILKTVNVSREAVETDIKLDGVTAGPSATVTVLASDKPDDENTLDQPNKVAPVTTTLKCAGSSLSHTFPGNSVTVLRVKVQ
ncbi:MAG TPA: alpha-L-arabinofuranosidase C-terminal domain-containing protein [Candidatus Binatia bacterium]|jgi:alpha-L-arabinofuranosidase|nr:alpha-L-arabinofuranosidase C-terminal domain-containing protein [Candidatus Binatia bacterium]